MAGADPSGGDHMTTIARWSGRRPIRLSVPGTDGDGMQTIEVVFEDGFATSVRTVGVSAAWKALRARLMMRAI